MQFSVFNFQLLAPTTGSWKLFLEEVNILTFLAEGGFQVSTIWAKNLMSGHFSQYGCFREKVLVKAPSRLNTDETDLADFH
jgi:hypothetical protein